MSVTIIKLSLAAAAGLLLGFEREAKHKPLGLKTCAVISIASCLLTIISIETALEPYNDEQFIRADPMRLAAQIVSGVGFLGAGVILRRNNDVISGLTTAAIVWAASGFGITIGAGYYVEAGIAIALIFMTISVIPYVINKIGPHKLVEREVMINIHTDSEVQVATVVNELEKYVVQVRNVKLKSDTEGHKIEMRCITDDARDSLFKHYDEIHQLKGIKRVEISGI